MSDCLNQLVIFLCLINFPFFVENTIKRYLLSLVLIFKREKHSKIVTGKQM